MVAAVIRNPGGKILIARRHAHLHQGGLWEFPGGKVEHGESVQDALVRELEEEVAITATQFRPLIQVAHDYPDRRVLLDVWLVSAHTGEAVGAEGQEIHWVESGRLQEYDFPAANDPIVMAAQLPECYLVTPEPGARENWESFLHSLKLSLHAGIKLVQFRAKSLRFHEYRELAAEVIALCKSSTSKVLLNASPELAHELGADGVHLTASRLQSLARRPMTKGRLVAASCHNVAELEKACSLGCDFAVLGPVKETASHPGQPGIGWDNFMAMSARSPMPIYALGGMSKTDLPVAWKYGAQGVAAIRSLWDGHER